VDLIEEDLAIIPRRVAIPDERHVEMRDMKHKKACNIVP
jgi:hypothetical protein